MILLPTRPAGQLRAQRLEHHALAIHAYVRMAVRTTRYLVDEGAIVSERDEVSRAARQACRPRTQLYLERSLLEELPAQ